MARDKAKDDVPFNCSQEHEKQYVASLYADKRVIYNFLTTSCANNTIKYATHKQVYEFIKKQLAYEIPN